jgi:hypothetical protein
MNPKDQSVDDHEAEMARSQLYKLAKYSAKLFNEIKEGDELEGWVQAKLTKASDYVSAVYHHLEYQKMAESKKSVRPTVYEEDLQESIKKDLRKNWSKCKKG